jgi:hypothetical protein
LDEGRQGRIHDFFKIDFMVKHNKTK